jgi:hypothetical protein
MVLPTMPMVAALSAAHLAAILFPNMLRRLYIARDDHLAGDGAMATLAIGPGRRGSRRLCCHQRSGISTRIYGCWGSTHCGRESASNSRHSTSFASCAGKQSGRGDRCGFWTVLADPTKGHHNCSGAAMETAWRPAALAPDDHL